jgi:hypothetical protein
VSQKVVLASATENALAPFVRADDGGVRVAAKMRMDRENVTFHFGWVWEHSLAFSHVAGHIFATAWLRPATLVR